MGLLRTLAISLCASLTLSLAAAQGGFDFGSIGKMTTSPVMLLIQPDFKKDLKLDKDQDKKITDICKEHQKSMSAVRPDPSNPMAGMAAMNEQADKANKAIVAELRPEQATRLRQLQWQCSGARALYEEDLQKALELTPEQVTKLADHKSGRPNRMMAAMQGGARGLGDLNKKEAAEIEAMLTPEQLKKYPELLGPVNKTAKRMSENSAY